jgi:filamentous hemagglutinin family protein
MLITKFSQMTKLDILIRWQSRSLGASIFTLGILMGFNIPASAEITYEGGKAATQTTKDNFTIPISEGKPTGGNGNLFHSFGTFGVPTGGSANFEANSSIQNIFGRVTGGAPSLVDGKLQVTGGNANLFLMNPAGIVFGKGASLDINGAFTATTANAIDFNGKWFNAFGANNYSELTGNPIGLAFGSGTPGSIFSAATISNAKPGQSITLVSGTVISTGDIKTAGGNISIATVEGGKYVKINVEGSILGVLLPTALPTSANTINSAPTSFTPQSLAALLTNTGVDLAATGVKNEGGVVTLVGNPAAVALIPDLDKAEYAKTLAENDKALADYNKALADYNKAVVAVGGNQTLVDQAIITARDNAQSVYESSNSTSINIQKKFDNLAASSVFGEPSLISAAISRGDTVSKQNRQIVSGDIIVKSLNTRSIDAKGGNVHIDSSRAILIGDINTRRNNSNTFTYVSGELNSYGGKVVLNAQTEIVAGNIKSGAEPLNDPKNTSAYLSTAGGNVNISTQTGDIIVESISTGAGNDSAENGKDLKSRIIRGGDLTVNAKGLFRVMIDTDKIDPLEKSSIYASPFGKIDIKHGGSSFVTGASEEGISTAVIGGGIKILTEGFEFLPGQSGARGFITTSSLGNGSYNVVYTNSRGFYDFSRGQDGSNGSSITAVAPFTTNIDPNKNSGAGKTGPEVAKNTSSDNSEEQNSTKDNSDNQASKPGESEEDKQQAKKRKQKAKCKNNSSAIASAKLGTDPTRSGNSVDSAAEEFCPPNIDNGILQILTDRN